MHVNKTAILPKVDKDIGETVTDKERIKGESLLHLAEQLIQELSVRYAHEVLNALTPALGVMQILKDNHDKPLTDKDIQLIQLAHDELIKGKNFINDFMVINFNLEPERQNMTVLELKEYIEEKLTMQVPEFAPHFTFQIEGCGDERVFIDPNQLRRAIYFIVNSWLDYATCPSILTIEFSCQVNHKLYVKMTMSQEKVSLADVSHGFKLLLHLIEEQVKRNDGKMMVGEGITLIYPSE